MQFLAWAFVGLIALLFTMFWMLFERRIPFTTLGAAFFWVYWGWNAANVNYGTTVVLQESYPAIRLFGIFAGLVNVLLLAMWLWTDEEEDLFQSI